MNVCLTVFRGEDYADQLVATNYTIAPAPVTNEVPTLEVRAKHQEEEPPLMDEDLLLASPIVYGFSLADKIWCK